MRNQIHDERAFEKSLRWFPVKNTSSEAIPPYGAMSVSGAVVIDGQTVIEVGKPEADGETAIIINGPTDIITGSYGQGTFESPCFAAYDSANTPAVHENWGADGWTLSQDQTGFRVLGIFSEQGVLLVERNPLTAQATRCNALLKGAYTSGGSSITVDNVTPLDGNSPVENASDTLSVTVYFENWPDMDDNAKVKIEWSTEDERWELYQADCGS